jgi:hypothetical protein
VPVRSSRQCRRWGPRTPRNPTVERLEERCLLSGTDLGDTVLQAQDLGLVDSVLARAAGAIGDSPAGAADVDWFQFTLSAAAHVDLSVQHQLDGSPLASVLTLYNSDPYNFDPPFGVTSGYRQLGQVQGTTGQPDTSLAEDLAPGTYFVAVSGASNRYFHPLLADSGTPGSTGGYTLSASASDLTTIPEFTVLSSDPPAGAVLAASPLVLRVDFNNATLDTSTVTFAPTPIDPQSAADVTVRLWYNPTGQFGNGQDVDIPLAGFDFSGAASELRLQAAVPLAPGFYQLVLAGDSSQHLMVLNDGTSNLGADPLVHPNGEDLTIPFQVTGIEGRPGTLDDVRSTAQELGDITGTGLVQVAGAIGDNPSLPVPADGTDVDLYHFHLSGTQRVALVADVFAGRIGSPLNPGVSLFRVDPATDLLVLVASNDDSLNGAPSADDFSVPLFTDPSLYAGLTPGDYYLAVSSSGNVPGPGVSGVFDPNTSTPYSGPLPLTTGPYILNVLAQPLAAPPQVISTSLTEGSVLAAPPTEITVQFSDTVNLQQLAAAAFQGAQSLLDPTTLQDRIDAVYVESADGTDYFPRLESSDRYSDQANFLMLDSLPDGSYTLHLSGGKGLTDLAGNPLVGNDPSGDHLVRFQVHDPGRGVPGNLAFWSDEEPNDSLATAENLGALFAHDLETFNGFTVRRALPVQPAQALHDTADYYQVQILVPQQTYLFNLTGLTPKSPANLPSGTLPELFDASGQPVLVVQQGDSAVAFTPSAPGTYWVRIGGWDAAQAANVAYQLHITIELQPENPVPLSVGPEPTFRLRLVTTTPSIMSPSPRVTLTVTPAPTTSAPLIPTVTPAAATVETSKAPAAPGNSPSSAPADVVLALAAGPVGGVAPGSKSDASSGSDRLLVSGPQLVLRDQLMQVAVLTQTDGAGGTLPSSAAPTLRRLTAASLAAVRPYAEQIAQTWQSILDLFFAHEDSTAEPFTPVAEPEDPLPDLGCFNAAPTGVEDARPGAPSAVGTVAPAATLLAMVGWQLGVSTRLKARRHRPVVLARGNPNA